MPNFFTENSDIQFHFNRIDIKEVVDIAEDNYEQAKEFNFAPHNYEDAKENYYKVLEIIGDISGNYINERSSGVDEEGAHFVDGKVIYASGTLENLKRLSQADLMGMILPRRFGGLNFPFTMYMIGIEMVSRADASLMNIFGLQDIGDTINKFGTEEQREKYLPNQIPYVNGMDPF